MDFPVEVDPVVERYERIGEQLAAVQDKIARLRELRRQGRLDQARKLEALVYQQSRLTELRGRLAPRVFAAATA